MLEVFVNFICAFMLVLLGLYIISIIKEERKQITTKDIIILIINSFLITLIHYLNSKVSFVLNFITNTITYKIIFNDNLEESFLETGLLMILVVFSDIMVLPLQVYLIPLQKIETSSIVYLISNIIIVLFLLILIKIKLIKKSLIKCYNTLSQKDLRINAIFISFIIIGISGGIYNLFVNYKINYRFISDMIIVIALIIIELIFIKGKINYNKLSNEYDILLSNVSTFEDWIEKEQFTRHEYKNQLAVLYSISSEKEVKNKIEEIINQNLNIKNEVVNNLKELPKGGLKGLLYYKTIVAEKNKLKITVDVSIKENGILNKLSQKNTTTLAKIVGILYDNAIDAAKQSRRKNLLLEIYELKDKVNIVISNTFKRNSILDNRFEKGVSSKGNGHGNGLYYLNKILKDNNWIEEKQEIIDHYYVVTITIKKNTSKK